MSTITNATPGGSGRTAVGLVLVPAAIIGITLLVAGIGAVGLLAAFSVACHF